MDAAPPPAYIHSVRRALSEIVSGNHAEALKSFSIAVDALRGRPAAVFIYETMGALIAAEGRCEEAIEFLVATQSQYPDIPLFRTPNFRLRQRQSIEHGLPAILLVTQFKSASMYLLNVMIHGLGLPFCRVACTPYSERIVTEWLSLFSQGGAVAQNHLLPSDENLDALQSALLKKIIVHVRDPRQSMISAVHYYSRLFHDSGPLGILTRAEFPEAFADWPVERKVDYYLEHRFRRDAAWTSGWIKIAQRPPPGLTIRLTSYENFRQDPKLYFSNLLEFFGVPPSRFDWSTLVPPREGELHYRKGETREWKESLTVGQADKASTMLEPSVLDYFSRLN